MAERKFYANLAWSITRFWFFVVFVPLSLSAFNVAPDAGFMAFALVISIWLWLFIPPSGNLPRAYD